MKIIDARTLEGKRYLTEDDLVSSNVFYHRIVFTSENSENVTWDGSVAVFSHRLGCLEPAVELYNEYDEQIAAAVNYIDKDTLSIDFEDKSEVSGQYMLVIVYVKDGEEGPSESGE